MLAGLNADFMIIFPPWIAIATPDRPVATATPNKDFPIRRTGPAAPDRTTKVPNHRTPDTSHGV
jgi:hypothetical protein